MKLQTIIPMHAVVNPINYNSKLLLLGSCFSENIGNKLEYFKFQSLQNPFGIVFHPIAIERILSKAIAKQKFTESDVFYLNERWHCFEAHSALSSISKADLLSSLNNSLNSIEAGLKASTHICITLGTSWVYKHIESNLFVANCHKVPQQEFEKTLLTPDAIQQSLESIVQLVRSVNKEAQLIFTVSPVRHLKDGFAENMVSKARLISSVYALLEGQHTLNTLHYFPSYEIMNDELRDYRFYADDLMHPNSLAINYIWEKFKTVWIEQKAYGLMEEVDSIQKRRSHRPFNEASEKHQQFLKKLERDVVAIQKQHPHISF